MRLVNTISLIAGLALVAGAGSLSAQTPTRNVPDSLVAKAKISEDSARAVALKRVPGTVESTKLGSKSGKLDWMFAIKPKGKSQMEVVTVDATTAHVVSVHAASSAKPKSTM